MKSTILGRMGAAALLVTGMTMAFTANAIGAPAVVADGATVSTSVQEALQRDLGLTPAQAETRLQQENAAWAADSTLRAGLGSAFAGSRFDATTGKLQVDVSDAARAADVQAAGATARVVQHSAAELNSLRAKLDLGTAIVPKSVTGWYVDEITNSVVVSVFGPADAATTWAAGLGAGSVRIEQVAEAPQTLWDLIGGQAIRNSSARCSLGFNARNSAGTRYVITAGHCGNLGGTWSGAGGTIGTVANSSFPTNDYSRITVSSAAAVSRPLVDRYSAGSDVTVTGAVNPGSGAAVCRSGSTTGWHCGTVNATNQTVCYPQGCVGQTIRTNVCAEPGDSGGSLVTNPGSGSRVSAVGLTSGGSGNCSSGGTTFFQPITEPLSVYGLTLFTG
jgi:streptogrisin C